MRYQTALPCAGHAPWALIRSDLRTHTAHRPRTLLFGKLHKPPEYDACRRLPKREAAPFRISILTCALHTSSLQHNDTYLVNGCRAIQKQLRPLLLSSYRLAVSHDVTLYIVHYLDNRYHIRTLPDQPAPFTFELQQHALPFSVHSSNTHRLLILLPSPQQRNEA